MTKELFLAAALLTVACGVAQAQNPEISSSSVSTIDSCSYSPNSPGIYTYNSIQISNPSTGMSVTTYWGDGTSSNQVAYTSGNIGYVNDNHNYSLPGTYTIKSILMDASMAAIDSVQSNEQILCTTIWGISYLDNNSNCSYDTITDNLVNVNQQIEVQKNGTPIDTITLGFGGYMYTFDNPDPGATYTLHPINTPQGYNLVCPAADYSFSLSDFTAQPFHNFGYTCDAAFSGFDLSTYMSGYLRVVNNSYLNINAVNAACTPTDGVLTLNISPKYSYDVAYPAPTSVSGNTLTWNLNGLSGAYPQYIYVALTPATTLTAGDTATNVVTITPTSGDADVSNNQFAYTDTIRSSYDPNDKKVSPSGYIGAGQLLTYTINFENLGNDTAFNIHVIDTLSPNVDYSTFKLVSSSHHVAVNHFETSDGMHTVRFDFDGIKLASAEHPESNKGFVIYQVKAKDNLTDGSKINNTAHIFFDVNPDVVTNTTVTTIGDVPSGVKEINKEDGIAIYPNPASDVLHIDNTIGNFSEVTIVNAVGQSLMTYQINKGNNELNLSGISKGIYYLMLDGKKGSRAVKLVLK